MGRSWNDVMKNDLELKKVESIKVNKIFVGKKRAKGLSDVQKGDLDILLRRCLVVNLSHIPGINV